MNEFYKSFQHLERPSHKLLFFRRAIENFRSLTAGQKLELNKLSLKPLSSKIAVIYNQVHQYTKNFTIPVNHDENSLIN